jgi:hypothetical protein
LPVLIAGLALVMLLPGITTTLPALLDFKP